MPANLLDPQISPQSSLFLQGGPPGHQGCSHGLWVPSPRAGPRDISKAPEAASSSSSRVFCSGPGPGWLQPLGPVSILLPPGSALTQIFCLGPGTLLEEPLLLLLPPAVTGALSPWGSAGYLCFTLLLLLLLLLLLGMFSGQAI